MSGPYYSWEEKWFEAKCDRCGQVVAYFKQDWTDGAGVTDVICINCKKTSNDKVVD
jgi:hypothetical protein